jgi:hypothetical protein
MQSRTKHQTPMYHKHSTNGMHFKHRAFSPNSHGYARMRQALRYPVCHHANHYKRQRDWGAFKIIALSRFVLREHRDCDVEAGQTSHAAENKKGEKEVVEGCAHTYGKCDNGGRHTEG